MRLGAIFPQAEIGNDPVAIRDWAQTAEGLGYDHIVVYDHIIGAKRATRPEWRGPYTSETPFHEVFVLLGYLAALTRRIELITGVVVLPLRQTVLVAKQVAALDVLSGGRLRLGVGVGWDATEYIALNECFGNRGARIDEQIALLRALWGAHAITFKSTGALARPGRDPQQRELPLRRAVHSERAHRCAAPCEGDCVGVSRALVPGAAAFVCAATSRAGHAPPRPGHKRNSSSPGLSV